ncbi:hypothetical protein OK006_10903 [Actinobacteria bacterium OK006]|nr:hypothetical protein OK006_10903 [Actinobacteria bacterium OK006]
MPLYSPDPSEAPVLAAAAEQLAAEFSQWDRHPLPVHTALLHRLLDVVLLRLAHLQQHGQAAASAPEPFLRFRDAVERGYMTAAVSGAHQAAHSHPVDHAPALHRQVSHGLRS